MRETKRFALFLIPLEKKNIARLDRNLAAGAVEDQPSGLIDGPENAFENSRRPRNFDRSADSGGERQPPCANLGKICASRPDGEPFDHMRGKAIEDMSRIGAPGEDFGKVGRIIKRVLRMRIAIHADSGNAGEAPIGRLAAFEQNASYFRPVEEKIVGPFDREAAIAVQNLAQGLRESDADDEAELGGLSRRRRLDQQKACVKVPRRRRPGSAVSPPASALRIGDDPEPPRIARAGASRGLVIGGDEQIMPRQPEVAFVGGSGETQ